MKRLVRGLWRAVRHPISQNTVALYWVQVATFVVPLVTLPYVSRVLEPSGFGLLLFAQGFSFILGMFIDFGFGASATRAASKARADLDGLAALVARVLTAKLMLAAGTLLMAAVGYLLVGKLRANPDLLALAWVAAAAQGLTPNWFFVGIERLRLVSFVQLSARVVTAALTFVLVTRSDQAVVVMALYAGTSVLSCGVVTALLYRRVPFAAPRLGGVRETLRESGVLFVGTGALALYSSANVVLLGLFVSSAQVAHFGGAERIVRAAGQLLGPVTVAVYPRVAFLLSTGERARARQLAWITLAALGGVGMAAAVGIAAVAGPLIHVIYGPGYGEAVPLLRILAIILPLVSVTATLAGGWMLSLHMDTTVVRVALAAAATNVVLALTLTPLFGPVAMACSVVAAEMVALGGSVFAIRRHEAGWGDGRLLSRVAKADPAAPTPR